MPRDPHILQPWKTAFNGPPWKNTLIDTNDISFFKSLINRLPFVTFIFCIFTGLFFVTNLFINVQTGDIYFENASFSDFFKGNLVFKSHNRRVLLSRNYRYDNSFHGHSMILKAFGEFDRSFCLCTYFTLQ